jgi:hypothetical protein
MKTIRIFGIEFKMFFSIRRVKRIVIPIPDSADDTHLRHGKKDGGKVKEWNTSDGEDKVVYYMNSEEGKKHEIPIPKCKESVEVFCSPLYNEDRSGYATNRKIIIDLYY